MSDVNAMRARIAAIEEQERDLSIRQVDLASERFRLVLNIAAIEGRPDGRAERFARAYLSGDHDGMKAILADWGRP